MRIICPIHGCQQVMCISPDICDDPTKAESKNGAVNVVYEFEDQLVDTFLLSSEFANRHGVHDGVLPLPDEYPKWTRDVASICKECFEQKVQTQVVGK